MRVSCGLVQMTTSAEVKLESQEFKLLKNLKLEPNSVKGFYFFIYFFFLLPQVTMKYFFSSKEKYPKKIFRRLLGSHKNFYLSSCQAN